MVFQIGKFEFFFEIEKFQKFDYFTIFSNCKIWIFQIVKFWKFNNFENSIIFQISQL